jgi:hypothetical protein
VGRRREAAEVELNTAGKQRRKQPAQSEADGGTELAAEETGDREITSNEAAGESDWSAPERELEPEAARVAPFTTSV